VYCPNCGASNADNAAVCVQCGRNLQAVVPAVAAVPNYLVFAILVTVLCCLPFGIPAIIYAAQVNTKLQAGDFAGAQLASKNAKMWCLIAAGVGLAGVICYGLVMMMTLLVHHR
jgi:hypothetical protein